MKHKTIWIVWLFIIMYAAALPIQLIVTFAMPLSALCYSLIMVVGSYTGIDMAAAFKKSTGMKTGDKYGENDKKLLALVIGICILMFESLAIQGFSPSIEIPLEQIVTAAGLISGLYAGGKKALNIAENIEGAK